MVSCRLFCNVFQKTSKKSYPQKELLEGTRMHQPLIRGKNMSVESKQGIEKYATSSELKAHSTVYIENYIMAVEYQNKGEH